MDKFLVPVTSINKAARPRQAIGKQRTLESLGKVVVFDKGCSPGNPSEESLQAARLVLQNKASSDDEILDSLRRLSSYTMISFEMLKNTGVGTAVRLLKQHHNSQISRVSQTVTSHPTLACIGITLAWLTPDMCMELCRWQESSWRSGKAFLLDSREHFRLLLQ